MTDPTPAAPAPQPANTPARKPARNRPIGQLLVAAYAVFAVSAGARSLAQIVLDFGKAPLAYLLSLLAAIVYLVATLAFRRPGLTAWKVALVACCTEMVGVIGVGALTYLDSGLFADSTVWTHFGSEYGYVPLVLPFLGLAWLRHIAPEARAESATNA